MNRRDPGLARFGYALFLLGLTASLGCARSAPSPAQGEVERPDCLVAQVGGDAVTTADAEIVRAAIQPPLTRDEAKRLAVTATADYRRRHPDGPLASMSVRLRAHRQSVREGVAAGSASDSPLAEPPVEPKECWAGAPEAR